MLKIKKGLKKKIKGKKGKGQEDDLFDPEQLEKYKKELEEKRKAAAENCEDPSASSSTVPHEQDEEWLKFQALTSGVDAILKKTSEGLADIKESSFYQRKSTDPTNLWRPDAPTGSSPAANSEVVPEVAEEGVDLQEQEEDSQFEGKENQDPKQFGEVPDFEPEVLDDSLFDTSYLDAIASGEIQLAYIPDSPTEEEGDDPFDTSGVADVCKRIEEAEKQAKRQVNLGGAVDVLSGKSGTSIESKPRPRAGESSKKARARPRAVNLLGEFDASAVTCENSVTNVNTTTTTEVSSDIFDDILGSPVHDSSAPIDLDFDPSSLIKSVVPNTINEPTQETDIFKDILGEFDVINQQSSVEDSSVTNIPTIAILHSILEPNPVAEEEEEDEFDVEFAALAAESAHKGPSPLPPSVEVEPESPEEEDPFDTTFVDKVAPGRFELKLIESEVLGGENDNLNEDDDFDFNPRVGEALAPGTICPNPSPRSLLEDHSPSVEHPPAIEPHFKSIATPVVVNTSIEPIELDPFDTSNVETVLPGKAELKLLEEELLKAVEPPLRPKLPVLKIVSTQVVPKLEDVDDDFDFDPRKDEPKQEKVSDHLFDIPHEEEGDGSITNILTPQQEIVESEPDPFDTSIVSSLNLGPGQLELRLLESELVTSDPQPELQTLKRELSDPEFNPRGEEEPDPFIVPVNRLLKTEDIFDHSEEEFTSSVKPLTPQQQQDIGKSIVEESQGDFEDPFDTSSIEVLKLLPQSELKQIEGELLNTVCEPLPIFKPLPQIISTVSVEVVEKPASPPPPPTPHLFETEDFEIEHKPLTPLEIPISFVDPFDTSIAEGVVPGKAELKFLEQELGVEAGNPRPLEDDPDFNPRAGPVPIHPSALSFVSKTLIPVKVSDQQKTFSENIDPFDTSAADSVVSAVVPTGPGKTELKALEAELL